MPNSFAKFLVFVLLLITLSAGPTFGEEGGFNYISGDDKGPERWGDIKPEWATCKTGKLQSPINIPPVEPVTSIGNLIRNYKPADATLTSDPNVKIEWKGDAGFIELDKTTNYNIANVHFHAPSEHTINGVRYDLEMHMVHTNPNAVDKVTVFAYLYKFGQPDPFLSTLTSRIKELSETNNAINLGSLDPKSITSFGSTKYRFKGSLTTPPCSEHVNWIVASKIKHVSNEQVRIIRAARGDNGEGNARPLQAINNRNILNGPFS